MRALLRRHGNDRAVAEVLGVGVRTVGAWRERFEIPPPERPPLHPELTERAVRRLQREYGTDRAICEVLNMSVATFKNVRRRYGIEALPAIERQRYLRPRGAHRLTRALTRSELLKLQRRYGTDQAIGDAVGCSRQRINQLRIKLDIPAIVPPQTRERKPPVTARQLILLQKQHGDDVRVAKALGVMTHKVRSWRKKLGVPACGGGGRVRDALGTDKRAALLRLQREHGSDSRIAQALGCAAGTVTKLRYALDIPPSEPRRGPRRRVYGHGPEAKPKKKRR